MWRYPRQTMMELTSRDNGSGLLKFDLDINFENTKKGAEHRYEKSDYIRNI